MNRKRLLQQMFGLTFVVWWLIGCSNKAPADPSLFSTTPGPATATPAVTATETHATKQPSPDIRLEETSQLGDNTTTLRTALAAHFDVAPEEIQFNISAQTEDHAKGGVPGGYFLAAREEGVWAIVYDGQATPGCAQIASYDFPVDMAPECMDENNNLIRRAESGAGPVSEALTRSGQR